MGKGKKVKRKSLASMPPPPPPPPPAPPSPTPSPPPPIHDFASEQITRQTRRRNTRLQPRPDDEDESLSSSKSSVKAAEAAEAANLDDSADFLGSTGQHAQQTRRRTAHPQHQPDDQEDLSSSSESSVEAAEATDSATSADSPAQHRQQTRRHTTRPPPRTNDQDELTSSSESSIEAADSPAQHTRRFRQRRTRPLPEPDDQYGITSASKSSSKAAASNNVKATKLSPKPPSRTRARSRVKNRARFRTNEHFQAQPQPGLLRQTWQAMKIIARLPPTTYAIAALIVLYLIFGLATLVLGRFERLLCYDTPVVSWLFTWIPAICPQSAPTNSAPVCTIPLLGALLQTYGLCRAPGWTSEQQTARWAICHSSYLGPPLQTIGFCTSDSSSYSSTTTSSSSSPKPEHKIVFENAITAAIQGARNIHHANRHAYRSWSIGAAMHSGEVSVRLLKNRIVASHLEEQEKEKLVVPLNNIADSLKPISRSSADFAARANVLSYSVRSSLKYTQRVLEDLKRAETAGKGQYRGRLLLHFVDPLHLLHTDVPQSNSKEREVVHRKLVREWESISQDIRKTSDSAEVLQYHLDNMRKHLHTLDGARQVSMDTVQSKGLELRKRNGNVLAKLWESVRRGEAFYQYELDANHFANNLELLHNVEDHVREDLFEIARSKDLLDKTDAHFRFMMEEFGNLGYLELGDRAMTKAIERLGGSIDTLHSMDKEAKKTYMTKSIVGGTR